MNATYLSPNLNGTPAEVLLGLSWSHSVNILHSNSTSSQNGQLLMLLKIIMESGIFVNVGKQLSAGEEHGQIPPLVYFSESPSDILDFITVMIDGNYQSEGLMLLTTYSLDQTSLTMIREVNKSRAFFHHKLGDDPNTLTRVQTFRDREELVFMEWERNGSTNLYRHEYDFQGSVLRVITTMEDYPYMFVVPHPENPTLAVYAGGSDVDGLRTVGARFNFTTQVYIQTDNQWGTESVANGNGNYTGVFGQIIKGNFDRSSNAFQWNSERHAVLDLGVTYLHIKVSYIMDVGSATKPDWALYIKPFKHITWFASCAMVLIVLSVYHGIGYIFSKACKWDMGESQSATLVAFIGSMCYMLTYIYWEGALTMFFTTGRDLPFKTIEEGLRLYPDFKLVMPRQYINGLYQSAKAGIAGMDRHLELLEEDPELIVEDRYELFKALEKPGRFTMGNAGEMALLMDLYKMKHLNLQELFTATANNGFFAVIFPKKSPWRKALDKGYLHELSTGQTFYVVGNYVPSGLPTPELDLKDQLDLRQTSMVFSLLGGLYILAIVCLVFEVFARRVMWRLGGLMTRAD